MNLERVRLVRKLQGDLVTHVYAHQKKIIAQKMVAYAHRNQSLLNSNTNTFIFDGLWYTGGDLIRGSRGYKPNRVLDPVLREEIVKLHAVEMDAIIQQGRLQMHMGQAVITANTAGCLIELLPYPLHPVINKVDALLFDRGQPLSDVQINEFKEVNAEGVKYLHSMLLLELLLAK